VDYNSGNAHGLYLGRFSLEKIVRRIGQAQFRALRRTQTVILPT
jgi:hypothetical protein